MNAPVVLRDTIGVGGGKLHLRLLPCGEQLELTSSWDGIFRPSARVLDGSTLTRAANGSWVVARLRVSRSARHGQPDQLYEFEIDAVLRAVNDWWQRPKTAQKLADGWRKHAERQQAQTAKLASTLVRTVDIPPQKLAAAAAEQKRLDAQIRELTRQREAAGEPLRQHTQRQAVRQELTDVQNALAVARTALAALGQDVTGLDALDVDLLGAGAPGTLVTVPGVGLAALD